MAANVDNLLDGENDSDHASDKSVFISRPTPPPNGGARAWLVAVGAFAALFCTFGYLNSFGVFQSYYESHFLHNYSRSAISFIGSLQIFLLFLGGVVSGPLTDRYGLRAVFIPSATVLVFAVMMTSLCSKYYQFVLSQGVLFGMACGMIFTPAVSVVGQYFTTKRAWAMGVAVSGASIGGIVFPIALEALLDKDTSLGFGPSVRIIGYIMLGLLAFAALVMQEHAPRRKSHLLLTEAFRSIPYNFTMLGFFFCLMGFWSPIFYISEYARMRGTSDCLSFYLIAIMNAGSFFGRTIPNFVADKVGRFNANIFMTTVTAILLFCWTAATSNAGIIVWISFYGFFQGALVSLITPCIAQVCPRPSDMGTYVGQALALSSFGGLVDTPVNGALIARWGFLNASMFSAVMVMAGAVCYLTARLRLNTKFLAVV